MPNTNEIETLLTDDNGQFYTPANNGEPATIKDESGNVIATSLDGVTWSPKAMHCDNDEPEKINVDDSDKVLYDSVPAPIEEPAIASILETESIYAVTDAAISKATSKLKAPLEDINTSETILEGILRILGEEVNDAPQLRYFIQALEGEKDSVLGEINAYRDAHARVMTNWWSTLIAADPSHSSLALRATFDMDRLGNLNESSYVAWWAENVLPWLKQHGEFFNHEMVEAQTQAILAEVAAIQSAEEVKH